MSKITAVTFQFDDNTLKTVSNQEAEKWQRHFNHISDFASSHNYNPFDSDKVKWDGEEAEQSQAVIPTEPEVVEFDKPAETVTDLGQDTNSESEESSKSDVTEEELHPDSDSKTTVAETVTPVVVQPKVSGEQTDIRQSSKKSGNK